MKNGKKSKKKVTKKKVSIPEDSLKDIRKGKVRITTMIDYPIYEKLKSQANEMGIGYQTLMNEVLEKAILDDSSYDARLKKLENAVFKKQA
ncbi:MAG: hypothetical protein KDD50_09600 [Bdellovibrionales bacterium]|nr:hypothetical protein [Bdellovibrionales bacterium]MCB0414578.1 hypothetical protein [Bdellovibrionales bacterium]